MRELLQQIHQWGVDRNIIGDGTSQAQFLKLMEEFTEYVEATTTAEIKDGIGDAVVVLVMIAGIEQFELTLFDDVEQCPVAFNNAGALALFGKLAGRISRKDAEGIKTWSNWVFTYLKFLAEQNGESFTQCIQEAYDEIKDRKGVLLDGIFIKSTDPNYQQALEIVEARRNP